MFFLSKPDGNYLAGYVKAGSSELEVHRGIGERILQKQVMLLESDEAAFSGLCMQMHQARLDGYMDRDLGLCPVQFPSCFEGTIPLTAHGVYVTVHKLTREQFEAGLARLQAFSDGVGEVCGFGVTRNSDGFTITTSAGSNPVTVNLVSDSVWATFPKKLQELCTKRGFLDCRSILPSGVGQLGFTTESGTTEIGLRAFLSGAFKAGAEFSVTGDTGWAFNPKKPFQRQDLEQSAWYTLHPEAYQALSNSGLADSVVMQARVKPKLYSFI